MRSRGFGRIAPTLAVIGALWSAPEGAGQSSKPVRQRSVPTGSALKKLVETYLNAEPDRQRELRVEYDEKYRPLGKGYVLKKVREEVVAGFAARGRRIERSGTHFFDPERRIGKYIVEAPTEAPEALFVGLHGGGVGSGDAGSMAAGMGGGNWAWVFPEVLEKTERGWVDSGTEEFVLELTEAARRSFDVDPDRVYVSGHSMGGHGTWSFAAHHPDIFAGGAAYAGGPSPIYSSRENPVVVEIETGLLPNLYRQNFLCFQSADDPKVPPGPNDFAFEALQGWKDRYPDGFNFRYVRVEDRGHAAPAEGYLPTQQWVASHPRDPWPKSFLWQPTLAWKQQYYWLIWPEPILGSLLYVEVSEPQCIDLRLLEPAGRDLGSFSLLLREPLVDLGQEVRVRVNGEERFAGLVPRRLSTLLMTAERADPRNLYEARLDL